MKSFCMKVFAGSNQIKLKLFFLLCVFNFSCKEKQPAKIQSEKLVTQELISLERELNNAFLRKDTAFISRFLSDDFIITYGDGSRGNKSVEVSAAFSSEEKIDTSVLDEFIVKLYDDWAIVMYKLTAKGIRNEKPFEGMFHFMDVFIKLDGQWRCVASQNTRIGRI
jgi:hypothetical protein